MDGKNCHDNQEVDLNAYDFGIRTYMLPHKFGHDCFFFIGLANFTSPHFTDTRAVDGS